MDRNILFIGDSFSFIISSIIDSMRREMFSCEMVPFEREEIEMIKDNYRQLFLYIDENFEQHIEDLVYLREICQKENRKIFLMGYAEEIERICSILPENIIGHIFKRPINAREVTEWFVTSGKSYKETMQKKHILVVDDSGTFLHMIKKWLEPKYTVSIVNSAMSAITFLALRKPDLILLDYEMPICSGPQMLQMLRSESATENIPVIFLTGKEDRESVQEALALKPQGYLLKTMDSERVLDTLEKYFKREKS